MFKLYNIELGLNDLIFRPNSLSNILSGLWIFSIFILAGQHENDAQGVPEEDTNMVCVLLWEIIVPEWGVPYLSWGYKIF